MENIRLNAVTTSEAGRTWILPLPYRFITKTKRIDKYNE
jgi:hypothetical protein